MEGQIAPSIEGIRIQNIFEHIANQKQLKLEKIQEEQHLFEPGSCQTLISLSDSDKYETEQLSYFSKEFQHLNSNSKFQDYIKSSQTYQQTA